MSLTTDEVETLLKSEKENTVGVCGGDLKDEREKALSYYLGDMEADMPSMDGRSAAVSTDVSDTIEGLMPNLMEVFAATEEVVRFEPVGKEDEEGAEQESDYVNHVFMQKNPGFLILYSFIKDALLSKLGIVKVYWDTYEEQERETYRNQPDDVVAAILSQEDIELLSREKHEASYPVLDPETGQPVIDPQTGQPAEQKVTLNDIEITTKREYACAKAVNVPPEEFGISSRARPGDEWPYAYHEPAGKTQAELIAQDYDAEQIKNLQTQADDSSEQQTRNQGNGSDDGDTKNEAMRPVKITEHYVRMAYDGDEPQLYRVTTGGHKMEVLMRKGKPDIVPVDRMPFAVMTPIIMPHRIHGRSIADLVMDIQKIKTALIRGQLDNIYGLNNNRYEVAESHAHERTIDDLLSNRHGGIIRTKQPGGVMPIQNQPIGNIVLPMIEYYDATREWRTGVTRQGQGIDANALQGQTATAVNQAFMAAQARVKLIARIFAETGIRDLFTLLHATIRKNETKEHTVRLRNKWIKVDPRAWKNRYDMTINVGLGTGTRAEKITHLSEMLKIQKEMMAGGAPTVTFKNIYNAAAALAKEAGFKSAEPYYTDPESEDGQKIAADHAKNKPPSELEVKAQLEQQKMQLQAQLDQRKTEQQAQIEATQAQADIATQQQKTEAEIQLAREQFALDREIKLIDAQLQQQKHGLEMQKADRAAQIKEQESARQFAIADADLQRRHAAEDEDRRRAMSFQDEDRARALQFEDEDRQRAKKTASAEA